MTDSRPPAPPDSKRTGGEYNPYAGETQTNCRSRSQSADSVQSTTSSQEPKAVIDKTAQRNLRAAKALWDLISHPEYADEDDGIDGLMTKEALYYAIQGKVFADEAYCSRNFRLAKLQSRNVRRARILSGKTPAGETPLGEYQKAYQAYMSARAANIQAARAVENSRRVVEPKAKKKPVENGASRNLADRTCSSGGSAQVLNPILPRGPGLIRMAPMEFPPSSRTSNLSEGLPIEVNVPFRVRPQQARLPSPPRIPRRKCGCKRVYSNPLPWGEVELPSGRIVSSHRVNYMNKPGGQWPLAGGIKYYLCKNDSDTEVTESCYPTANDMLRQGESDTDPDMPALKTKEDLAKEEKRGSLTVGEHAESLTAKRDLLATHAAWREEDGDAVGKVEPVVVTEKTLHERLDGLKSKQDVIDPEFRKHCTGGGGAPFLPDTQPLGEGKCVEAVEKEDRGQVVTEAVSLVSPRGEKPEEDNRDDVMSEQDPVVIVLSDTSSDGSGLLQELKEKFPEEMAEVDREMEIWREKKRERRRD